LKRVVDALKDKPGVTDVTPNIDAQPLTVTVRFDGQKTNAQNIGEIAKQATEADPKITGPVELVYEEEK
jgi:hypothetical protein